MPSANPPHIPMQCRRAEQATQKHQRQLDHRATASRTWFFRFDRAPALPGSRRDQSIDVSVRPRTASSNRRELTIDQRAAGDHEQRRQRRVEQAQRRADHAQAVIAECPGEVPPDHPAGPAGQLDAPGDAAQVVAHQADGRRISRHVGPAAQRDPDVAGRQGRGVVDSVADHADRPDRCRRGFDRRDLRRARARPRRDAQLSRDRPPARRMIAGEAPRRRGPRRRAIGSPRVPGATALRRRTGPGPVVPTDRARTAAPGPCVLDGRGDRRPDASPRSSRNRRLPSTIGDSSLPIGRRAESGDDPNLGDSRRSRFPVSGLLANSTIARERAWDEADARVRGRAEGSAHPQRPRRGNGRRRPRRS